MFVYPTYEAWGQPIQPAPPKPLFPRPEPLPPAPVRRKYHLNG